METDTSCGTTRPRMDGLGKRFAPQRRPTRSHDQHLYIREAHQLEDEIVDGRFTGVIGETNKFRIPRNPGLVQDVPDILRGFWRAVGIQEIRVRDMNNLAVLSFCRHVLARGDKHLGISSLGALRVRNYNILAEIVGISRGRYGYVPGTFLRAYNGRIL